MNLVFSNGGPETLSRAEVRGQQNKACDGGAVAAIELLRPSRATVEVFASK